MDNIILDTSIFIKENFFHGKKINSLLDLCHKGKIQIYITEITYNELKSNFRKFLSISVTNHNQFRKNSENWILQNDKDLQKFFPKVNFEKIASDFEQKLDNLINDLIIKIIPYKALDIKLVFDKYFKPEPPFGKGEKKSEFPDAFTLELIEDFCNSNAISGIIFSTDKDLLSSTYPSFKVRDDYQDYLEDIYTKMEKEKKNLTDKLFILNSHKLKQAFVTWFKDYLEDDYSLYYDVVNWKDVYDVEVEDIIVGDLSYTIIQIVGDVVTIEVEATVKVKVNVLTDDENHQYYDSDDKSYHYYETNYETFEEEFDSALIAFTEIIDEDDYSEEFEVESVNDDNEISFKPDYYN